MFDVNGLSDERAARPRRSPEAVRTRRAGVERLRASVLSIRPTAIVGVSTVGGAFTRQVIENMSAVNERPVIFPYSNPTVALRVLPRKQAYGWSGGRAIFASGSPFPPVTVAGEDLHPGAGETTSSSFPRWGSRCSRRAPDGSPTRCSSPAARGAVAAQVTEPGLRERASSTRRCGNIRRVSFEAAVKIAAKDLRARTGEDEAAEGHPQVHTRARCTVPAYR
jgi:malate dehydrogenase (oxaloacetate-decarboxylating)(NADP+)